VREKLHISERRVCRVIDQPRSTQRRNSVGRDDEGRLREEMIHLAGKYGRYGYRRITVLLKREGFRVNHKRVERIWRQEGLKVPKKQPKRGRLWFKFGSGRGIGTMCGLMTSWQTAPMMGDPLRF